MGSDRRRAPRYQFIADAEVVEIESGAKFRAKTGDLSIGGCFLDLLNPSPEGTEIRVTILRENAKFTGLGRVVFVFPNLGMGVVFTSSASNEVAILESWLGEVKLNSDSAATVSK